LNSNDAVWVWWGFQTADAVLVLSLAARLVSFNVLPGHGWLAPAIVSHLSQHGKHVTFLIKNMLSKLRGMYPAAMWEVRLIPPGGMGEAPNPRGVPPHCPRELLAPPSELLASPSELLASPSEILASPSELLASLSELLASLSELLASPSELLASPSECFRWSCETRASPPAPSPRARGTEGL
jgi:hypothetical protein